MQGPRPVSPVLSGLVGEGHHTDPRHVTFTLADAEGYGFCLACAWEVLLDSKQLTIRKRTIAFEMLKVLSSMDEASDFLSTHGLASTSLAFCAQVLGVADDALARTVLELAALLQGQTTDKSACIDSIRFQLQTLTWKQARHVLVLLGRLVCDSSIAELLVQSYGPLIEHLLGALSYPDEDTRTTCTFVLLNLASVDSARERLMGLCGARLVCSVVELLSKSQSDGVHTNAIALLHALAAGAGLEIVRGSSVVERGHLVKALKPRLLSSHEPLRALTMQVIARVCTGSPETVAFYLEEGIADFVIEASCKASGLVLSSSIGVLTLFSDQPSFGSYVQFGFDALIEVLHEAIERLPQEGFRLLLKLLASCSSKLKSESLAIVANCINRGICREEPDVAPLACLVLAELVDCASINKREDVQPVTLACLEEAVDRLRACAATDSMDQHYLHAVLYVTAKCIPSPAYEPSSKQLFLLFVEKMLPLILARWDQLSSHSLLAMVLRLLLLATPCHLDRVKALMGVSAYTIALSLRSRVQGEPTIVALADQFLLALILSATNTAASSALEEVYRRSVPRLPENVEAMSVVMTERSRDLELQLTILALFYSAVHAGDRVVDVERVDSALQTFFRSHPDLDQIPPDAFHVLTFLVSVAQSRAHGLMSENGRTLTRAILSTCHQMARKPPVAVIKWLWQNPELRDYNRNQMLLWISDTSDASYTLAEWVDTILDDSNGAAVVMDMVTSCDELSTKGLHLVQACLVKSPDATGLFASLGLMPALERMMTFRAMEWSAASLSAAALCTLQHLRHAHRSAPLTSPLHVVALLAREASRRQLPDELLLMLINAGNMIILLAGRQPDSEALVCSVAQSEKLIEIVCASLAATSTSLNGGIMTVAALTFWTQLVPKLALVHGTRWQDSKTLERLLCAASMATFKQHQRGPSMLLRLLASHGLSAFLSLQGEASADRPTTSATYEEIRECIVLAQNNVQLAEEQTFKLASVACLSKLMAVEARMQAGGPPSTLPWNQFLTENIIASIPAAPLQLPDIHFLTMIVRHKPRWLPSVMGATTIEALLLKFACSVNIPLVMGYIDLLRELHAAGMITTALHPVASRVIQKQQKDIATMMRADAMEQESSNEQLLWQEIDGVVVPQHMLWPGHSTTAEEAARQLHALAPLFAA